MTLLSRLDVGFLEQQVASYEAAHGPIAIAEHETRVANKDCNGDRSGTCSGTPACICGGSCSGTCVGSTPVMLTHW
jgi:hypothetical protein